MDIIPICSSTRQSISTRGALGVAVSVCSTPLDASASMLGDPEDDLPETDPVIHVVPQIIKMFGLSA